MAVASVIIGILSAIFCMIPLVKIVGVILALVGIILGALATNNEKKGLAIAGLCLSLGALMIY